MRFKHNREYFALVVVLAVLVFFVIGDSETDASPHPQVGTVYENDLTPLIVDFNGDGIVNFKDFSKLAQYWLQDESSVDVAPPPLGDLMVDIQDVAVLAEYWLKGGLPVGPEGGTVSDPGGASVDIPPGALAEETLISVDTHFDTSALQQGLVGDGVNPAPGKAIQLPDQYGFKRRLTCFGKCYHFSESRPGRSTTALCFVDKLPDNFISLLCSVIP